MSAGFGGLFQTPLAALFFAMEVMIVGEIDYKALFPAFIGAFSASYTSHFLGLEKFSVEITQSMSINNFKSMLFQGRYSGLGTNLIDLSFHQGTIQIYDWLLKLVFTIITLAIGFQGGEVTPLFSIGASLGIVLALIFHLPIELCAALGYVAVFASATNTLIAPMMISIEVFGGNNMMLFIIVCIFAYLVNGNQSIYGAQMKHLD